ncbi:hypothetical protein U9M48_020326 [Paspalum notatum var. saurae]|uniref:F-box/LRR-repeat protein 15/At3g58940/PEG3-like LRR domain-containing protein n=1 Tax=Paspalum notatum var. saurae TaxID=547442 RepID=A0AAQ3WS44_PASNO
MEQSWRAVLAGCPALDRFVLRFIVDGSPKPRISPSALHLSPTLRSAEFGWCQFPDATAHQLHFPNLQQLSLQTVTISEGSLHALLSGA